MISSLLRGKKLITLSLLCALIPVPAQSCSLRDLARPFICLKNVFCCSRTPEVTPHTVYIDSTQPIKIHNPEPTYTHAYYNLKNRMNQLARKYRATLQQKDVKKMLKCMLECILFFTQASRYLSYHHGNNQSLLALYQEIQKNLRDEKAHYFELLKYDSPKDYELEIFELNALPRTTDHIITQDITCDERIKNLPGNPTILECLKALNKK